MRLSMTIRATHARKRDPLVSLALRPYILTRLTCHLFHDGFSHCPAGMRRGKYPSDALRCTKRVVSYITIRPWSNGPLQSEPPPTPCTEGIQLKPRVEPMALG